MLKFLESICIDSSHRTEIESRSTCVLLVDLSRSRIDRLSLWHRLITLHLSAQSQQEIQESQDSQSEQAHCLLLRLLLTYYLG